MHCTHCGTNLPDDAQLCTSCSQYPRGPQWTCPKCGTSNPSDQLSCPSCGFDLNGASQAQQEDAPQKAAGGQAAAEQPAPAAHDASTGKKRPARAPIVIVCAAVVVIIAIIAGMAAMKVGPFAPKENPVITLTEVADEAWRAYLQDNVDTNESGIISDEEALAVTSIGSPDEKDAQGNGISGLGITDLTGIEQFVNLTTLVCSGNKIPALDLSANTQLTGIICNDNGLSSLALPETGTLTTLHATGNSLDKVDLSHTPSLSDIQLDKDTAIVGSKMTDEDAQTAIEDMTALYFTAASHGEALSSAPMKPRKSSEFDAMLISGMLYSEPNHKRPTLEKPYKTYGIDGRERAVAGTFYLSDEAIRQILTSFYGTAPDSTDYLDGTPITARESDGWRVSTGSVALTQTVKSSKWKAYGRFVTSSITITTTDGLGGKDEYRLTVKAKKDGKSVFGYHLVSVKVASKKTLSTGAASTGGASNNVSSGSSSKVTDYEAYLRSELDKLGLLDGSDGFEIESEDSAKIVGRTYNDLPDHVATTGRYVLDKETLKITDDWSGEVLN